MENKEKVDYKRIVLGTVGFSGLVALAVIAPNVIQVLPKLGLMGRKHYDRRHYVGRVVASLEKKGLIRLSKNSAGVLCVRLTPRGEQELKEYELKEKVLKHRGVWEGKFHLVAFDIKEWKRGKRDELRSWLSELGLVRLQNSLWVFPHDCTEIVALLKAKFGLGKEVLHIVAESVENDHWLRKEFALT